MQTHLPLRLLFQILGHIIEVLDNDEFSRNLTSLFLVFANPQRRFHLPPYQSTLVLSIQFPDAYRPPLTIRPHLPKQLAAPEALIVAQGV